MNILSPFKQDTLRLRRQVKQGVSLLCGAVSDRRHDEVTRTGLYRQRVAVLGALPKGLTNRMISAEKKEKKL